MSECQKLGGDPLGDSTKLAPEGGTPGPAARGQLVDYGIFCQRLMALVRCGVYTTETWAESQREQKRRLSR